MATISQQKIDSAAQGNASSLREVLNSISQATSEQQTVTGTIATQTVAGQPNRNAPVPPQATGTVSLLSGSYILQIVNPGAKSPISSLQAAAAGQAATATTNLQAVKSIYHQIRASTSPAFNVNSNTQVFGGDTGSAQTNYTLTGLGTGRWFFQFRSTYDGINFNTWRNINQGTSVSEITVEGETNAVWTIFTLPGDETVGVGQGFGADGATIGLPQNNLFTSAMFSLVTPNGFNTLPPQVNNIATSEIVLQEPIGPSSAVGVPDFPALISMKYGDRNNPQSLFSGNGNFFGIAFDPTGVNTIIYDSSDGISSWVVITLPGGAKIAFGSGQAPDGTDIYVPTETPWLTAANMVAIPTIQGGGGNGFAMHGVKFCEFDTNSFTVRAEYDDFDSGSNTWSGVANWLAVAWTPGLITETVTGGEFVVINLADGNRIAFGASNNTVSLLSGSSFGLPTGFNSQNMLAIASPNSQSGSGDNDLHCVANCSLSGTTATLIYTDGSGNSWSGSVNWFAFCWVNG